MPSTGSNPPGSRSNVHESASWVGPHNPSDSASSSPRSLRTIRVRLAQGAARRPAGTGRPAPDIVAAVGGDPGFDVLGVADELLPAGDVLPRFVVSGASPGCVRGHVLHSSDCDRAPTVIRVAGPAYSSGHLFAGYMNRPVAGTDPVGPDGPRPLASTWRGLRGAFATIGSI